MFIVLHLIFSLRLPFISLVSFSFSPFFVPMLKKKSMNVAVNFTRTTVIRQCILILYSLHILPRTRTSRPLAVINYNRKNSHANLVCGSTATTFHGYFIREKCFMSTIYLSFSFHFSSFESFFFFFLLVRLPSVEMAWKKFIRSDFFYLQNSFFLWISQSRSHFSVSFFLDCVIECRSKVRRKSSTERTVHECWASLNHWFVEFWKKEENNSNTF